jgi:hypothetical protein
MIKRSPPVVAAKREYSWTQLETFEISTSRPANRGSPDNKSNMRRAGISGPFRASLGAWPNGRMGGWGGAGIPAPVHAVDTGKSRVNSGAVTANLGSSSRGPVRSTGPSWRSSLRRSATASGSTIACRRWCRREKFGGYSKTCRRLLIPTSPAWQAALSGVHWLD